MQFGQTQRLKCSREFDFVFKSNDLKVRKDCFLFLVAKTSLDTPRLGLVVAKKNIKKSTKRNQVKRIIRESFRQQLTALPSLDIIVLVCKPCAFYDKQQFWQILNQSWQALLKKLP